MGKVKELMDDSEFTCPFGTEDDGVTSIWTKELNEMDQELDTRLEAIHLLQRRITEILVDNDIDYLYNLKEIVCVCDDCLKKERVDDTSN